MGNGAAGDRTAVICGFVCVQGWRKGGTVEGSKAA